MRLRRLLRLASAAVVATAMLVCVVGGGLRGVAHAATTPTAPATYDYDQSVTVALGASWGARPISPGPSGQRVRAARSQSRIGFLGIARRSVIAADNEDIVRVGRWMSPEELAKMEKSGRVQYGQGGTSYVTYPPAVDSYKAAPRGSVYVEYDVPRNSLYPAGQDDWAQIPSPDSATGQRYAKLGNPPPSTVPATNIRVVSRP